jgi:hypothetical protein
MEVHSSHMRRVVHGENRTIDSPGGIAGVCYYLDRKRKLGDLPRNAAQRGEYPVYCMRIPGDLAVRLQVTASGVHDSFSIVTMYQLSALSMKLVFPSRQALQKPTLVVRVSRGRHRLHECFHFLPGVRYVRFSKLVQLWFQSFRMFCLRVGVYGNALHPGFLLWNTLAQVIQYRLGACIASPRLEPWLTSS